MAMVTIPVAYNVPRMRLLLVAVVLGSLRVFPLPDVRLCGFLWLTGQACPLCGLTRAVAALARGDWGRAIELHALSPLLLVVAAVVFIFRVRLAGWMWAVLGAAVVGYWLWRW
ncbi:MAG: DUF2752 domain-containing protein [Bryobacteraceae bacterium]|nr:DUF2752 domain-containing protein [Bryobacteraceae bacterium]